MSARQSKHSTNPTPPSRSTPADTNPSDELVLVGAVAQAHGIRGELRIHQFNPDSDALWNADTVHLRRKGRRTTETFAIRKIRPHNKGPLLSLEGCSTRNQAEELRGAEVLLPADQLPDLDDDEFYYYQIEGLPVFDTHTGESLGTVLRVMPSPAQNLLVIAHQEREILIPLVEALVPLIDLEEGRIEIDPIPGLLEE